MNTNKKQICIICRDEISPVNFFFVKKSYIECKECKIILHEECNSKIKITNKKCIHCQRMNTFVKRDKEAYCNLCNFVEIIIKSLYK